jgi:SAM-dependent methyltransferase
MFQIEAKRRQALQLEAELIQQHVQNGAMLDVGCSAGHFFEFFPLAQWQRYGVEMSEATAQFASQTYSAQVKPGTLLSAQFPDNNFDLVSFIDMFYYVDDPVAELSEARRILKPQGSLAIEISGQAYTFARSRGVIAWLLDKSWCRLHSDSHLYWFNPWGLNSLLAKAGFTPYAWYVSPSPHHGTFIVDALSTAHYHVSRIFSKLSFKTLNWAPKYLCLAHPV